MRAVIQRVSKASVSIENRLFAEIGKGLLILLGIEDFDNENDIDWLAKKILQLRIFDDENNLMNLSVQDIDGECLVVSQFTLFASTKKGNRPSFIRAANPDFALKKYEDFVKKMSELSKKQIFTGKFATNMQISLQNEGPVTIIIDTKNKE